MILPERWVLAKLEALAVRRVATDSEIVTVIFIQVADVPDHRTLQDVLSRRRFEQFRRAWDLWDGALRTKSALDRTCCFRNERNFYSEVLVSFQKKVKAILVIDR